MGHLGPKAQIIYCYLPHHAAFMLCALIAGVSVVISWKLPHYSLRRPAPEE